MSTSTEPPGNWRTPYAQVWAETIRTVLGTPFPYHAQHMSRGPQDCDVTPTALHPAFHASLDWHSSAHMQWSAIRLLTLAAEELEENTRTALVAELDSRLTLQNCRVEAAYLRAHPSYERPYGWAWSVMLAAAAADCPLPQAEQWTDASHEVAEAVAELLLAWMPRVAYPVRHGVHSNTAFGIALCHAGFAQLGRDDVVAAIGEHARRWFHTDRHYPVQWEPSGEDFVSPALCEADLMRRILPENEFTAWLATFLPHLAASGDPLFNVPRVLDRTDGKMVHLYGLALSRAWQLRLIAPYLTTDHRARIASGTRQQIEAVEREIIDGDFMSTHWLVSFALLAVTATSEVDI